MEVERERTDGAFGLVSSAMVRRNIFEDIDIGAKESVEV